MADMTEDGWKEKYKPIINPFTDGIMFETYGKEIDFVREHLENNPRTVWTDATGDEGGNYIFSGYRCVNRLGYYITEIPFDEGDTIHITLYTPEDDFYDFIAEDEREIRERLGYGVKGDEHDEYWEYAKKIAYIHDFEHFPVENFIKYKETNSPPPG